MIYDLPKSVNVGGAAYEIRTDYRAILDILNAIDDPELNDRDKARVMLEIFYFSPDCSAIPSEHIQEAIDKCAWFIDCGEESHKDHIKTPKVMDWEQDYPYIVAPINRVTGHDIRGIPYNPETNEGGMHWWTFISAYYEIGDCTFAQIVRIRKMIAMGKKLDKSDKEWYRQNRNLVDFKVKYTEAEKDILKQWGV